MAQLDGQTIVGFLAKGDMKKLQVKHFEIDSKGYLWVHLMSGSRMNLGKVSGGPAGESAYEIAVRNGFEGSEKDWLASLKGESGESVGAPTYIKEFTKNSWTQIGNENHYFISIPKKEHGLTNPYVAKVVLEKTDDSEDTPTFATPAVCRERLLSTGTIKIYITVNLKDDFSEYSGKIYLVGE